MMRLTFGIRALLLAAFFVLAGNVIQNIYIPTQAVSLGMSVFEVSLLGALYFIGFMFGCMFMPRFLYAVGHIRTFSSFASIAGICVLTIAMTENSTVWAVCRLLTGVCLSALYLSIESWISGFSTDINRGKLISIYRIIDVLGCLFGQALLFNFMDYPYVLNFTVILFLISFIPLSLTEVQMPVLIKSDRKKISATLKETLHWAPLSFYAVLISGVVSGAFWSMIPVFTVESEISAKYNPVVVAVYLLGGALVQWPLGNWSDRVDRRKVILLVSVLGVASSAMINFLVMQGSLSLNQLLLLVGLIGAAGIPIYSLAVAHANDWIDSESLVGLSVVLLLASSMGSALGPLLVGSIPFISVKYLFVYFTVSHFTLFILALHRILKHPSADQSKKSEYHTFIKTSPALGTDIED